MTGDQYGNHPKAPAKINLSLDARFRHPDGEHEWKMVMTSVDLADYVHLRPSRHLRVTTDSGFLPEDPRNLAYQQRLRCSEPVGYDPARQFTLRNIFR